MVAQFAPRRSNLNHPPALALFERKPVFIPVVDRAHLDRLAQNDEHARAIASSECHSMICVPLIARGAAIGVLTLMLSDTRRSYTERDLAYAKQLANKAAQAVENSRLYRRATDAIAARDEFLGVCSHELKTPITSMKLQLQIAEQDAARGQAPTVVGGNFGKRIGVAMKQVRRMEKLIDDMLDVSRIVTGQLRMRMERVALGDVVSDTVEQMGERFRSAGVALNVSAQNDVLVSGDRVRLAQVLDNLLSNAIKYGGGSPVSIELLRIENRAILSVRDEGPGITDDDLKRLFRRFGRAEATKYVSGVGLGLYISREIAEAHGGTIEVESTAGQGARFTVVLPAI
jgi:signal transduction histidine kinase